MFGTVEVNATFYRLPAARTVERWAERAPTGFCFAVEASRWEGFAVENARRLLELLED